MPAPNHDFYSNLSCSYTYQNIDRSSGTLLSAGSGGIYSTQQSFGDHYLVNSTRTPGFRKIKPRLLPWNAYLKETYLYRASPGAFRIKVTYPSYVHFETHINNARLFGHRLAYDSADSWYGDTFPDDPTQKVVSRLIDQVKLGNAQMGVFLAEADKTAAHLAHTATRIVDALRALRKGRLGDLSNALGITFSRRQTDRFYTGFRKYYGRKGEGFRYDKRFKVPRDVQERKFYDFLASTWLEIQYGWKPLLMDVYGHAEALAAIQIQTSGHWRTATARAKSEKTLEKHWTSECYLNTQFSESQLKTKIKVEYSIPSGVVDPTIVFGLTNPLSVAWEVVPFSFVADWFLPIGNALEALSAYQGLNFRRGIKSELLTWNCTGKVGHGSPFLQSDGGVRECIDVNHIATNFGLTYRRTVLSNFPAFGWPKFKNPVSFSHAASALALLQSLFLSGANRKLKLR